MAAIFSLPEPSIATDDWKACGFYYARDNGNSEESANDMLSCTIYDYGRDKDGNYFDYSSDYRLTGKKRGNQKTRRDFNHARKQATRENPTDSPDKMGHFCSTIKLLVSGRKRILSTFYKYPRSFAIANVYLPPISSQYLSEQLSSEKVNTSDWLDDELGQDEDDHPASIAVIQGTVVAPKSMDFRFFGAADDYMMVKFDGKTVLETGYMIPSKYRGLGGSDPAILDSPSQLARYIRALKEGSMEGKSNYVLRKIRSTPYCNRQFGGLTGGSVVSVREGELYPIEIIIGDVGGTVLYYLLTQECNGDDMTELQLFRTNRARPNVCFDMSTETSDTYLAEEGPKYKKNSLVWKVVPHESSRDE